MVRPAARRAVALLSTLSRHEPTATKEYADLVRMLDFARLVPDPFDRAASVGHFTASALVVSVRGDEVLLLHHRRLDRWLPCGGHIEPDDLDPLAAALRETREESGLLAVAPHPAHAGLLDVDVHSIPATSSMPMHEHFDLRFILVADPALPLSPSTSETKGAAWLSWDEAERVAGDRAFQRLLSKARRTVSARIVAA